VRQEWKRSWTWTWPRQVSARLDRVLSWKKREEKEAEAGRPEPQGEAGLGWTRRENTIAQLRRQTQDKVSGWSVGGWFDDGSSFALRSDLGPSSKRAVQLCTRCDRATNR